MSRSDRGPPGTARPAQAAAADTFSTARPRRTERRARATPRDTKRWGVFRRAGERPRSFCPRQRDRPWQFVARIVRDDAGDARRPGHRPNKARCLRRGDPGDRLFDPRRIDGKPPDGPTRGSTFNSTSTLSTPGMARTTAPRLFGDPHRQHLHPGEARLGRHIVLLRERRLELVVNWITARARVDTRRCRETRSARLATRPGRPGGWLPCPERQPARPPADCPATPQGPGRSDRGKRSSA